MAKRLAFWAFSLLLVYGSFEILFLAGLFSLEKWKNLSYQPTVFKLTKRQESGVQSLLGAKGGLRQHSATLGWNNRANFQNSYLDKKNNEEIKTTINVQGIRANKNYPLRTPDNVIRILAFGDSFTFGSEVSDKNCWTVLLDDLNAQIEVLNFGVGGYSLDQAFMRYQEEGKQYNADIVLIGFMTENIKRHVNVFRPFLYKDGLPASKPRFLLYKNGLKLIENPLMTPQSYNQLLSNDKAIFYQLGEYDYFYQQALHQGAFDILPSVRFLKTFFHDMKERFSRNRIFDDGHYNTDSEAFKITVRLVEQFYKNVQEDGAIPIVVVFPHRTDVNRRIAKKKKSYLSLLKVMEDHDMRYIDLMGVFEQMADKPNKVHGLFMPGGHYSSLGNKLVANYVFDYFNEQGLMTRQ